MLPAQLNGFIIILQNKLFMVKSSKTIFFEDKYGVDINDFKSTIDIDNFMEKKLGRKLQIKRIETNILG